MPSGGGGKVASIWPLSEVKALEQEPTRYEFARVDLDMCMYGKPAKKPTTLLINTKQGSSLSKSCNHETHEMMDVIGFEGKAFRTEGLREYPQGLCAALAKEHYDSLFGSNSAQLDSKQDRRVPEVHQPSRSSSLKNILVNRHPYKKLLRSLTSGELAQRGLTPSLMCRSPFAQVLPLKETRQGRKEGILLCRSKKL